MRTTKFGGMVRDYAWRGVESEACVAVATATSEMFNLNRFR